MQGKIDLKQVSVANLTIGRADPVRFVEAAAKAGFGAVGLLLMTATPQPLEFEVIGKPNVIRDIKAALSDNDMRVFDVEAFVLSPSTDLARFRPALEIGAELGATHISSVGTQWLGNTEFLSKAQREDMFGKLCDQAAESGLHVGVEYMLYRDIETWRDALDLIESAGRANAGLIVDLLHHFRGGSTAADLAGVPANRIAYAQLCDALQPSPHLDDLPTEARGDRLPLGEGVIPLADYLKVLPEDTQLVIETPVAAEAHLPISERLRLAAEASIAFFRQKRFA